MRTADSVRLSGNVVAKRFARWLMGELLWTVCSMSLIEGMAIRGLRGKMGFIFERFYRAAVIGAAALVVWVPSNAAHGHPTFRVLHSFTGRSGDGGTPEAGLVRDSSGSLYGATLTGGTDNFGAIFKIAADGTESLLYSFTGGNDGYGGGGHLVLDGSGNLYGTSDGGANQRGIIFRLSSAGSLTVLYTFTGGTDGQGPGAFTVDGKGNLYGTTGSAGSGGYGTVYKFSPKDKLTVLYSFSGGSDGALPNYAPLVRDSSGNLYGTTFEGGNLSGYCAQISGCGTVFKVAPDGTKTTLYAFADGTDGAYPASGLALDGSGNVYGGTQFGGRGCNHRGCGVVYKVAPDGTETVLRTFSGKNDGAIPTSVPLLDSSGNLYGSAQIGGANGQGTIFKIAPDGTFRVLYALSGSDGYGPSDLLLWKSTFYGTAFEGGANGYGTVFRLKQ